MKLETLERNQWKSLAENHRQTIRQWTEPFRERRRENRSHPVHDFLFVYYQYSPAKLEQWHPGIGFRMVEAQFVDDANKEADTVLHVFKPAHYELRNGALVCAPHLMSHKERSRLEWIAQLLRRTQTNRANYSCLGLHEWAMVYQGQEVRHEKTTEFRLPQQEIDQLVESRPITCTHFDAFRFFADDARPLNRIQPTLESRPQYEQPACIHANMDLYKWAFKSMPWVGSELLRECFDLALDARAIDMRASPYDLTQWDEYEPIRIETAEGRSQYERLQREIADCARGLRESLAQKIESVISMADATPDKATSA